MSIVLDGSNTSTLGVINSKTAVASTSGTSIDFTGIPAGVKRITVMFNGVSTNGSSFVQMQIGSGSVSNTGYTCGSNFFGGSVVGASYSSTTGFLYDAGSGGAGYARYGQATLYLIGSNTWIYTFTSSAITGGVPYIQNGGGVSPALVGTLDRVRITTVNGTDTFDAGSINILYE